MWKHVAKNLSTLSLALLFNIAFFIFAVYIIANYPHWMHSEAQCAITGYDLLCPTPNLCRLIQQVQNAQLCNTTLFMQGIEVAHGTYEQLKLTIEAKFAVLSTFTIESLKECWVKSTCDQAVFVRPYDADGYGALVVFLFTLLVATFALCTNAYFLARGIYFRYEEKKRVASAQQQYG